jgi:hypothetical protein
VQPDDAARAAAAEIARRHGAHPTPKRPEPGIVLPTIPDEFWKARDVYGQIRQAAHARMVSGDAVLHTALARISAMREPTLYIANGFGKSSANYFAAPVGPSGTGKSVAANTLDELLPLPVYLAGPDAFADGVPIGTGEGIVEAYMGMEPDEEGKVRRAQVRRNAFMFVDEGETFTKLCERTGSVLATTIRSGWVGQTIGQQNASNDRTRILRKGAYSLGMAIGFQPETALPLILDTATGTAQRFAWASAVDPAVPCAKNRPVFPRTLSSARKF